MIWLQGSRWARWVFSALIMAGALWTEFGTGNATEHPFAVTSISPGEEISSRNTEMRQTPVGLLEPVDLGGFASRHYQPGEPITRAGTTDQPSRAHSTWWALEVDLPQSADVGDEVQLILLDSGTAVPGVVDAVAETNTLGSGTGSVAVPPEHAAAVATAQAAGRLAILVSSG